MRFSELIAVLEQGEAGILNVVAGHDPELRGAASLECAQPDQLSFLEKGNALTTTLETSAVGAVLIPDQDELKTLAEQRQLAWAVCRDPRLAFAEALEQLHPRPAQNAGIHPSAVIADRVQLGAGVSVAANVTIGDDTRIGAQTVIHPGVVIYGNVEIGDRCELHANAVLHPGCRICRWS